jgi:hypothetical protein
MLETTMPSRGSYSVTVASSAACPQARRIFLRAPSALCRQSLRPLMQRPGGGSSQRRCSAVPMWRPRANSSSLRPVDATSSPLWHLSSTQSDKRPS